MVLNWKQGLREELDYLEYEIHKLKESMQARENSIKQAGISPEEQRSLKQAAILSKATDKEIVDTMLGFMDGSISIESLPWATAEAKIRREQKRQQNIKQAGTHEKDIEMLQTFREFGRF